MKKVLAITAMAFLLSAQGVKYWPVKLGSMVFTRLELASTDDARIRGLMFRRELPCDGGMLFAFDKEEVHSFWMRNTLIPLDILYLDADCKVVSMHRMAVERPRRPNETEQLYDMTLTAYPSGAPAQFAIELNAGQISKCGIKVGQTIDLRKEDLLKLLKKQ